jgi:anti-sigma-K factor RskA
MSHRRDEELMMLHDGELSEREARAAEERAAASPEDRARLDSLKEIGDVLRTRLEMAVEAETARLDGLWQKIEAGLEPERERAEEAAGAGGFWAWIQAWRGYFATGLVAAAAGAILAMALREPRTLTVYKTIEVQAKPEVVASRPEIIDAEVESLEVVGGTGTVFHIPSEADDEAPTTVIWVSRDDTGPEDPI